jgi:cystathionine beta-lyase
MWRFGHFGMLAAVAAYTDSEPWLDQLLVTLDQRRTQLAGLLKEKLPMVTWHPPEATFLAWLNCSAIGPDDTARSRFLDRGRVALEPGPRYGAIGGGYVRLNFATSDAVLDDAVARMAAALR